MCKGCIEIKEEVFYQKLSGRKEREEAEWVGEYKEKVFRMHEHMKRNFQHFMVMSLILS